MTSNSKKEFDKKSHRNSTKKEKGTGIHPRAGCKDVWNAYMVIGAKFCEYDIPFCSTTATECPKRIITWEEAKRIYKSNLKLNKDFKFDAFICFYMDDYKFDGTRGIWHDSKQALRVILHFAGIITPDFSTYQDFPEPIKLYATYRMRAFGYWVGVNGVQVINNVRWGTAESWKYSFSGIPKHSIVAIGTVGGNPHKLADRKRFEEGFNKMIEILEPKTIIVYGSSNYSCFEKAIHEGIEVMTFQGNTSVAFERRGKH